LEGSGENQNKAQFLTKTEIPQIEQMEFRLRRKTTEKGDESPRKKNKFEKFAVNEKIL
jgi:hypothetical protein